MAVSHPADAQEREADQVAAEVARTPRPLRRDSLQPAITPEKEEQSLAPVPVSAARQIRRLEEEELQARLFRQEIPEEEEALQTRLLRQEVPEEEEALQTRLLRQEMPEEDETLQARLLRQEMPEEEEEMQMHLDRQERGEEDETATGIEPPGGDMIAGRTLDAETERRIEALRGMGDPLSKDALADMRARFGRDFSAVRVHTDAEAAALCAQVRARAFTVGNDVFFAPGELAPETERGRELLAHELAHVVQQSGGATRKLMRNETATGETPPPAPTLTDSFNDPSRGRIDTGTDKLIRIRQLRVPDFKLRFFNQFRARDTVYWRPNVAAGGQSREERTQQRTVWEDAVQSAADRHADRLLRRSHRTQQGNQSVYYLSYNGGNSFLIGNEDDIKVRMRRPTWTGEGRPQAFQVDHQVEDQLGGPDAIGNMWLLDAHTNQSAGPTLAGEIDRTVSGFIDHVQDRVLDPPADVDEARRTYRVEFERFAGGLGGYGNLTPLTNYYLRRDIERGRHLRNVRPMSQRDIDRSGLLDGDAEHIDLFPNTIGGYRYRLVFDPASSTYTQESRIGLSGGSNSVSGQNFDIQSVSYNAADHTGSLIIQVPGVGKAERMGVDPVTTDPIPILPLPGIEWGGRFDKNALKRTVAAKVQAFPGLSPLRLDDVDLDDQGVTMQGQITPNIPLLRDSSINFAVQGEQFQVWKTFTGPELNLPGPLQITSTSLTLTGSNQGFSLSGRAKLEIANLGEGYLAAEAGTSFEGAAGFAVEGGFSFDTSLFDPAEVTLRYADGALSGSGTLGIPEGKVPGVRSATIRADYARDRFSATGEAELAVPGVERGTLTLTHSEEEGTTIGGTFTLSGDIPGIRGGEIGAEITRRPEGEGYKVSASGEAQPDIPGVDSTLSVEYDDGAFTASVTASYARGMLSGEIEAGATNRTLNAEGEPTGDPGEEILVYGGGEVTIQIAPWLQGTAGIRFAPDGEVTVTGRIGLPSQIEIFPRQEVDRRIFSIAVQAPIIPGIVAEIGGGLSAQAGIGPGVIDRLELGIEYNPAHEEDTHVTGDGHLNVPADAGLRLSVRAGIGLGITGASATGGLEIGGTLGIEGAAEASVHVDWMPSRGLEINARVGVHAQPAFTFDISGYVSVRVLGFSVYDETWELASYRLGSDYRFGISLPVRYREGEPFDISLSDVEFEIPDIDTDELLSSLIDRIA
jgi:hypothetical protein